MSNFFKLGIRSSVFAVLAIGIVGVEGAIASDFPRLLSSQEVTELRSQYQQDLKIKGRVIRRTPREKDKKHYEESRQRHKLLNRPWQQMNHPAASFIGVWSDPSGGSIGIYPVQGNANKICAVSVAMEGDTGFYYASLNNNMILTSYGEILFIENGNLVSINIKTGINDRFREHLPMGIQLKERFDIGNESGSRDSLNQFLQQEKCLTYSNSYQATEKEQTIESLPDGRHIYGIEKGMKYISFLKQGDRVFGDFGQYRTDNVFCFFGKVSRNNIPSAKLIYPNFGRDVVALRGQHDVQSGSLNFDEYSPQKRYLASGSFEYNLKRRDEKIDRCITTIKKELNVSPNENGDVKPELSSRTNTPSIPIAPPRSIARPPNSQELALLDRQPKRQTADRTQIKNRTNNFLKPFAGGWQTADNQKYYVYPSIKKERQACIIVENGSTQDLQIGVANGNTTGTDINVGTSRLFKTQNANTIALRLPSSETLVPLYASAIEANITPENLEMMQQVGCMTSFLGVTK